MKNHVLLSLIVMQTFGCRTAESSSDALMTSSTNEKFHIPSSIDCKNSAGWEISIQRINQTSPSKVSVSVRKPNGQPKIGTGTLEAKRVMDGGRSNKIPANNISYVTSLGLAGRITVTAKEENSSGTGTANLTEFQSYSGRSEIPPLVCEIL